MGVHRPRPSQKFTASHQGLLRGSGPTDIWINKASRGPAVAYPGRPATRLKCPALAHTVTCWVLVGRNC